uniref:Cilia- and flagella-associated protein 58 central coiled coil domain-containing protein n=1 Tax=Odontella aurita TaxID=265563 RepID=A0A7S4IY97_9STRA|mmetsp:Transcript_33014/g.98243  ORF Transcript_33014/g.98243 Transcript_33014/m.98243 type:complete len:898 (+) Transcript_33014:785-3478(+)
MTEVDAGLPEGGAPSLVKDDLKKHDRRRSDPLGVNAGVSTSAFDALEREFNEVLEDLADDPSLDKFRIEYERLFRALKKSHDQERRLARKCREINSEVVEGAAKIQAALRMSREDKETIEELRRDSGRAWAMVEEAHQKESKATETIDKLRGEVDRLSSLIERADVDAAGRESSMRRLAEERDDLQDQIDRGKERNIVIERQLREAEERSGELEDERDDLERRTISLADSLKLQSSEAEREQQRRERAEAVLAEATSNLEKRSKEHIDLQFSSAVTKSRVNQLEKDIREAKKEMEKQVADYEEQGRRIGHLMDSLESQKEKTSAVSDELQNSRAETKLAVVEQARIRSEKDRMERKYESERKEFLRCQQAVADTEADAKASQEEAYALRKELDRMKSREEQAKRELVVLVREKNLHLGRIQRTHDKVKQADEDAMQQDQVIRSLEKDLAEAKEETSKLVAVARRLEKERDRHSEDAGDARLKCSEAAEELRLREVDVQEMKKALTEAGDKMKEQHQEHEATQGDRQRLSKELMDARAEAGVLAEKMAALDREMKVMRGELSAKDSALVKEHYGYKMEKTQKEQQKGEISRLKQTLQQNDDVVNKQDAELRRLGSTIRKMDEDALTQRKEYDQIVNERDILGTQLIRRNDELALLYEKVKIQQTTLRRGEVQYQERLEDLRLLRLKIKDLRRELAVATGGAVNVDEITRELIRKNRELLRERTKVRALSEELENPLNVHRWRKLEGSDPATYEMIQKIQLLQKRLIKKTEQVVEKESIVHEQEKHILELKKILARQPGAGVAEKLSAYQNGMKEKQRQMKAMAGELNMHQAQVNEYKYKIDLLNNELHDMKRKFFEQKRKEALAKEVELSILAESKLLEQEKNLPSKTRFTGGGFAIK